MRSNDARKLVCCFEALTLLRLDKTSDAVTCCEDPNGTSDDLTCCENYTNGV